MQSYILGIDQGTTSTRVVIFNHLGQPCSSAQQEFQQYFPHNGWVEHDAKEIWQSTVAVCRQAIAKLNISADKIAAIGISNQRETTIVWDKKTGEPIYKAIVWQDRRTAKFCEALIAEGKHEMIQRKTGLLVDPYFSATKIHWLLNNVSGAREKAKAGELAFGTIDTFLLWHLTDGESFKTDATNASRTLLFNIETQQWDSELLTLFDIPQEMLAEVCDNTAEFGYTAKSLFTAQVPVSGMAGDQHAALIGQTCFQAGMAKSTYGTGCFLMMNTGDKLVRSKNRLLTTLAYRLQGNPTYALEGSIFVAGAAVQWLRDTVHMIDDAKQTEVLAKTANENSEVYLVPAFTGLGAPYWDPHARGAILGLTRDSGVAEIVRATLEAIAYQSKDLLQAMLGEEMRSAATMRVDGGMVVNDWLMQFLADILNLPIERPVINETSVLGAVYLAGLQVGVFKSFEHISQLWHVEHQFKPTMKAQEREQRYAGWQQAVRKVLA